MGLCGVQWSGTVTKTGEDWRIGKGVNGAGCIALQGIIFRIRVERRSEMHKKTEGKLSLSTPLRHIDGVEVWLRLFLTSTRDRDDWETREVVVKIDPTQGLVLRPTCVPEK
jgi:hypothetical protein